MFLRKLLVRIRGELLNLKNDPQGMEDTLGNFTERERTGTPQNPTPNEVSPGKTGGLEKEFDEMLEQKKGLKLPANPRRLG